MTGKVAVITGASRGIGVGLVTAYRRQGWAVVATARTIKPSQDPDATGEWRAFQLSGAVTTYGRRCAAAHGTPLDRGLPAGVT
jgi:NAD(P)-dependent dehydrogenase (short-subunit alcohol dehydrogenase family)